MFCCFIFIEYFCKAVYIFVIIHENSYQIQLSRHNRERKTKELTP